MKGYKAFNANWKCRDFQYEIGQTYELPKGQKLEMCRCGFHFCKNPIDVFGYYPFSDDTLIAEVEALGEIKQEGTKFVTDKIKIVREFTREELQALIRNGGSNTGSYNSGDCNSGCHNSGDFNTGDCNSGDYNSGSFNSGSGNSGSYNLSNYNSGSYNSGGCNSGNNNSGCCNSGNDNSGDWNAGGYNTGNRNTGYYNSGSRNTGSYNSGNRNSGCYNSGDCNAGHYNSGDLNVGIFNTDEPCMRAFNKLTNIKYSDFHRLIHYDFYDLCNRISKNCLEPNDVERIKALPNFDAGIFKEITGIDLEDNE